MPLTFVVSNIKLKRRVRSMVIREAFKAEWGEEISVIYERDTHTLILVDPCPELDNESLRSIQKKMRDKYALKVSRTIPKYTSYGEYY